MLLRLRSDEQLVALFRQGNEDAFRVIHDRYRQRLTAYARQMLGGSATDADDAMQDVFLRAYAALRADDRPLTLRAWLYRVAHNRCIDHLRRPASQPTDELLEDSRALTATTGDPIVAAEGREALRRLVADVQALPEQQRSALLMREMEGLTYLELAAALDVTVPAVKSLLVRARMGLVESQQARDTPCLEIREDITAAHDRGVRASGRARRHARECAGCAGYRTTLRGLSGDLGALSPSPGPWSAILKLLGLGAGGSGAAGGAAAAGGGAAAAGGGAVGATATGTLALGAGTKLAAVMCCAAVFSGSVEAARELRRGAVPAPANATPSKARAARTTTAGTPAAGLLPARARALGAVERVAAVQQAAREAARERSRTAPKRSGAAPASASAIVVTAPDPDLVGTSSLGDIPAGLPADGGAEAPAEDPADGVTTSDPGPAPATTDPAAPGTTTGDKPATTTGSGTGPTTSGSSTTGTSPGTGTNPAPPTTGAGTAAPATGSGPTGTAPGGTAGPRGDGAVVLLP